MKPKENSRRYKILVAICSIIVTVSIGYLLVGAGTLDPESGPVDTMKTLEDIYCKQLYGCTATSYATDSPAAPGSTMYTLTEIYDQVPEFPNQKHQRYDDWNCANNNTEASSSCDVDDPEYVGEEATWSSSTDADYPSGTLDSGKVYKDERTGLYWSDKATDTQTNEFEAVANECADSEVTDGTCDPCSFTTKGNAVALCCDLDLDCSANGCSASTDWRLPTQKEIMQAYIDGAANNLPNPDQNFWSSTEHYSSAASAWYVDLDWGPVAYTLKNVLHAVRCVRP